MSIDEIKAQIEDSRKRVADLESDLKNQRNRLAGLLDDLRNAEESEKAPQIGKTYFYINSNRFCDTHCVVKITALPKDGEESSFNIATAKVIAVLSFSGNENYASKVGESIEIDEAYWSGELAEETTTEEVVVPSQKVWRAKA